MKRFIIKKIPYVIDMFSRVNFVSLFCLQIKENFFLLREKHFRRAD